MFTRIERRHIKELNAYATLHSHTPTGAQLMSVETADENKVFGITFRTPPEDSTGVAHILEHSVLCGSRKYPVKEPFAELLKGSLQTFLNAFTFPDKTCYPVASQNLRDFYNLIDVYMDAVLYPRLTPHTHAQEAWHYEIENPDDPLIYKGVVFNEMKGVYSSPDSALAQHVQESIFPDITYGLDYGGRPRHIPDLTFEQLSEFHRRYYHPSNARIYFYGDDPPEQRLKLMDEWLGAFDALDIDSAVPLQARFSAPREVVKLYPGDADAKAMITVNWLLCETTNIVESLGLEILAHILIGTPASPLRKVLIESGLGEDLAGMGIESQLRQMYFSTGLKGVAVPDIGKVAPLIFQSLETLARDGFDAGSVASSLNTVEFRLRENNTGAYPRGLSLMTRSLTTWLYDGDPFAPLEFEAPLEQIKASAGAGYFEGLLRRYLLDNPHRTTLVLKPDANVGKAEEDREKARLFEVKKALSPEACTRLIDQTSELKRAQAEPDSIEALARIPRLALGDLEKSVKTIPNHEQTLHDARHFFHDLPTNGIIYADVGFNLSVLPTRLLPFAPLLGHAFLEMGTEKEDFVALDQRIGIATGGIEPDALTMTQRESGLAVAWLFLRGKAMAARGQALADILRDVLTIGRLDDRARFRHIVLEEKADLESDLIPSGHSFVNTRLRSQFTAADWVDEQIDGIDYLLFLRALVQRIDKDWPGVHADLSETRLLLVNRNAMICNITSDTDFTTSLLSELPASTIKPETWTLNGVRQPEGLAVPSQVNYVGLANNLYRLGYTFHGSAQVIARHLRNSYLWDRVRVQGGAYGGMCWFDHHSGVFSFASYRDPNLAKTLQIYRDAGRYLREVSLSTDELQKAIIGAIGDLDQHQLPDAKGFTSMARALAGDTDAFRQRLRDEVLGTRIEHFRNFGETLSRIGDGAAEVVLGSEDALKVSGNFQIRKIL